MRTALHRLINEVIVDELGLDGREQYQVIINLMLHLAEDFEYEGLSTGAEKAARFFDEIAKEPAWRSP